MKAVPTDSGEPQEVASRFASKIKNRWRAGERADVASLLDEYPELKQHKSVVLDLAYHEYRHRLDNGESLDAEGFSRRFPTLQRSLVMLIEVHRLLSENAHFEDPQEAIVWPEPGEDFLRFALLAELGRGTFGRVFLASEPDLGNRLVALKVSLQGAQEAEMLGRLRHPNIVPIHSVREDRETGLTAVCMPYLGKATLSDVLDSAFVNRHPPMLARVILDAVANRHAEFELPEESQVQRILRKGSYINGVVYLAVRLTDALAYTHSRGICHRDLKPSNILISNDCRPLLLDFNLSFDERKDASRFGGTLPYMSPEQLRLIASEVGDCTGRVDPRSDLFSLGVIVYELLSGSLPFGRVAWGQSLEDTACRLLEQQANGPQRLWEKNSRINRSLAQTIERCLAFDPDRRPESAASLYASLLRELGLLRRARRWARHRRKPLCAVAAGLLAAATCWGSFLALREPYHMRQLHRGFEYSEQGHYALAIECFDTAIQAAPDPSEALFARGRAYEKSGSVRLAVEDFVTAFKQEPSAKTAACIGYCLNKIKFHKEALRYYRTALDMGPEAAPVLNNMGYTCLQLGRPDDGEKFLQHAAEIDESLQAPHRNLALLYLRRAQAGRPLPEEASFHVSKAIGIGPPAADLYCTAAVLCMTHGDQDAQVIRRALGYLDKGHSLGLDAGTMKTIPVFRPLEHLQEFKELLAKPPGAKPAPPDQLLDPCR